MNTARLPVMQVVCRGCGRGYSANEVYLGYCDYETGCHELALAAEQERRECAEEMQHGFVCTCGGHKEVA